jgi:hypothetical protein
MVLVDLLGGGLYYLVSGLFVEAAVGQPQPVEVAKQTVIHWG